MLCAGQVEADVQPAIGGTRFWLGALKVAVYRAIGVYTSRALLPHAVGQRAVRGTRRSGGSHQTVLDLVGGQLRVFCQHQGHHARDLRGAHGRTAHLVIVLVQLVAGMVLGQPGLVRHQAQHAGARGDQIGLDKGFIGRTRRREGRDRIFRPVARRIAIAHRANSDHIGHVARHADAHRVGAVVARGDDDHDPGLPGTHHGLVERIVPVPGADRGAERKVHNPDVVLILVRDGPANSGDDVGIAAHARLVQHLHGDDPGVGGHAVVAAVAIVLGVAGHRSDDGAVPVLVVVAVLFVLDRVPAVDKAVLLALDVLFELFVLFGAAVHHDDAYPAAGGARRPDPHDVDPLILGGYI